MVNLSPTQWIQYKNCTLHGMSTILLRLMFQTDVVSVSKYCIPCGINCIWKVCSRMNKQKKKCFLDRVLSKFKNTESTFIFSAVSSVFLSAFGLDLQNFWLWSNLSRQLLTFPVLDFTNVITSFIFMCKIYLLVAVLLNKSAKLRWV